VLKKVPLVHLFLDVLIQLLHLAQKLLPPLLRRQVAEVLRSRALRGGGEEEREREREAEKMGGKEEKRQKETFPQLIMGCVNEDHL